MAEITVEDFDRHGNCPVCEINWDGGDIFKELSKLDIFTGKTKNDVLNIAKASYGYNPSSPTNFSKLITINQQTEDGVNLKYKCSGCYTMFIQEIKED